MGARSNKKGPELIARIFGHFKGCFFALFYGAGLFFMGSWAVPAHADMAHLPLYPDVELEDLKQRMGPNGLAPMSSRLTMTRFWFGNPGLRCSAALDTLALVWWTSRLLFICPYAPMGRTRLGFEASPEIQWPGQDAEGRPPRPGLRLAHIQNTPLSPRLKHVLRLGYKLAWVDPKQTQAPEQRSSRGTVSVATMQSWSDLFDATIMTGLVLEAHDPNESGELTHQAVLFEIEQTLPLSLRRVGLVEQTALAHWSRVGLSVRRRTGAFSWGAGLSYASLAFEWVQFSGLLPSFHFGYDFGWDVLQDQP